MYNVYYIYIIHTRNKYVCNFFWRNFEEIGKLSYLLENNISDFFKKNCIMYIIYTLYIQEINTYVIFFWRNQKYYFPVDTTIFLLYIYNIYVWILWNNQHKICYLSRFASDIPGRSSGMKLYLFTICYNLYVRFNKNITFSSEKVLDLCKMGPPPPRFCQISTFRDPLNPKKWFSRMCLSVCVSVCLFACVSVFRF